MINKTLTFRMSKLELLTLLLMPIIGIITFIVFLNEKTTLDIIFAIVMLVISLAMPSLHYYAREKNKAGQDYKTEITL